MSAYGNASALALLREGYAVALAGRRESLLREAADESGAGERELVVRTDVRDADSIANLFAQTKARFARLDVLFNNAGCGAAPVPLEELALDK